VWPHLFRATIARGDLIGRQLQNTADKLCEGELQPLLTHLVKTKKLSDAERRELRNLLDQFDEAQD
jgi:predicted transcriptional regulator